MRCCRKIIVTQSVDFLISNEIFAGSTCAVAFLEIITVGVV